MDRQDILRSRRGITSSRSRKYTKPENIQDLNVQEEKHLDLIEVRLDPYNAYLADGVEELRIRKRRSLSLTKNVHAKEDWKSSGEEIKSGEELKFKSVYDKGFGDFNEEYIREKRQNVWSSDGNSVKSVSDKVDIVINSDSVKTSDNMWEMDPPDLTECDCLGPPPEFLIPPPPRPPFIQAEYFCGDDPIPDIEACDNEPKIDAYNHSSPSLQTSAVIGLCSVVLILGIFVGALLVWKHKRKVTNLFPSKSLSVAVGGNAESGSCRLPPVPPADPLGPLYEDLPERPHRPPCRTDTMPQLELAECNRGVWVCGGIGAVGTGSLGAHSGNAWRGGSSCVGDACDAPLYEELPHHRSDDSLAGSDDHFAEDELSLAGEGAGRGRCRGCPPPRHPPPPHPRSPQRRRPRSLDRRRGPWPRRAPRPDPAHFHEGVLLDALLRLYPQVGTVGAPGVAINSTGVRLGARCGPPAWPVAIAAPRASPKPPSQDSSFGSDSGYSNNTCGTCGTRASSRHRLSAHSADLGMS